jgi:fructokinase
VTVDPLRLGVDLGGTKIAACVLDSADKVVLGRRIAAPQGDYGATIDALVGLVGSCEHAVGRACTVGIGMPGSLSPRTGLVQNANSTWLNGRPLKEDLERCLERPVRLANDANCFALSEAVDGSACDAKSVFGVILGTGCGGGLVIDGKLVDGPRGIGGEWGHNPLPWPTVEELAMPP